MAEFIRCFICIEIPDEIKQKVINLQDNLKKTNSDVKWVEKGNLHITLAFLTQDNKKGISRDKIQNVKQVISNLSEEYKEMNVQVRGIKVIPSFDFMRVLFLNTLSEELENVRKELVSELKKLGINPLSNPCHLTLGRVRSIRNKENLVKNIREQQNIDIGEFKTSRISFKCSKLTPKGPIYTEM